jgi:hypothetical protein
VGDRCCLFGKISKKGSTVLELAFSQSAFPASSKQIKNNYYFTVCPFAQKEYAYDNDYDIFKEVTSRRNTDMMMPVRPNARSNLPRLQPSTTYYH